MKKWYSFILLAVILLTSCGPASDQMPPSESERKNCLVKSPLISDNRISVYRNGISNGFILSETGFYCTALEKNGTFVLYCDKESDQFVYLCSRIDCNHSDETCDAFLGYNSIPLGYFKNKLYYIKPPDATIGGIVNGRDSFSIIPQSLWQMDIDGRNKRKLTDCYEDSESIVLSGDFVFSNGYIEEMLQTVNEKGDAFYTQRYTSLEDPNLFMETAGSKLIAKGEWGGGIFRGDGDHLIIIDRRPKKSLFPGDETVYFSLYTWDPVENSIQYIGDRPLKSGYFGADTAFVIEDGVVKRWDYQTSAGTPLFDTGIRTSASLSVFPDCIVVSEVFEPGEIEEGIIPTAVIRFYGWDYKCLGECTLTFDKEQYRYGSYIFGETEDRIMLVKNYVQTWPDYYIEKSDFGSGEITLHEYHYPEMDLLD